MIKIAEHTFSRNKITGYALIVGLLIGGFNALFLPIDFTLRPQLFGWLIAAIIATIFIHEGLHGIVAVLFGYKPIFGLKPPLVYITFAEKIHRGHFILVALTPLIVLNTLFGILFGMGMLKIFAYFGLIINTLGATGDVWITCKLLPHERGTLVMDTKTGIEVWKPEA